MVMLAKNNNKHITNKMEGDDNVHLLANQYNVAFTNLICDDARKSHPLLGDLIPNTVPACAPDSGRIMMDAFWLQAAKRNTLRGERIMTRLEGKHWRSISERKVFLKKESYNTLILEEAFPTRQLQTDYS
ncbi:hypothetical protein E2C01_080480 [Portunus trituberculatus]|uniref:Uncharacterized protein n=1 Tax=Portunus trituberculatus TaxID=210409 RepID=A0A5B7IVJ0_PORTR|nr:hypothetical protein [Portunus trituberculatus]